MKVAVSVNELGEVIPHLGKCKIFYIFTMEDGKIEFIESRITDGNHQNHIIEDIKDCEVVISGQIGEGMIENLEKLGIKAVIEEEINEPVEAVSNL